MSLFGVWPALRPDRHRVVVGCAVVPRARKASLPHLPHRVPAQAALKSTWVRLFCRSTLLLSGFRSQLLFGDICAVCSGSARTVWQVTSLVSESSLNMAHPPSRQCAELGQHGPWRAEAGACFSPLGIWLLKCPHSMIAEFCEGLPKYLS